MPRVLGRVLRRLLPALTAAFLAGCGSSPSGGPAPTGATPAGYSATTGATLSPTSHPSVAASAARTTRPGTSAAARPPAPPRLVASARWTTRDGVRTLVVVPTTAGRASAGSELLWSELVRRVPSAGSPGMHDQLVCHQLFASDKARWNLEPSRPEVGLDETIRARCNPGPQPDPDVR